MRKKLHLYRFEFLLFALLMVIFNKIFFASSEIYLGYVWEFNMLLLGVASFIIFNEKSLAFRIFKNILLISVMAVPVFSTKIFGSDLLTLISLIAYLLFYSILFWEVMQQITRRFEVTMGIILGSLSGFLLLVIVATFSFLLKNFCLPNSFNGIAGNSIPEFYYQFTYFSIITLTTIGFGDITPASDNARLLTAFWGVVGQFYMVTVVGIIISKFTSR